MTPHRQAQLPPDLISLQAQCSPSPSSGCDESFLGDESQKELDLCDDKGLVPDPPAVTGLFHPTLFKSLLHKARATAQLGVGTTPPETFLGPLDPDTGFFSSPVAKQKEIPTPKLFRDMVLKQWTHPGSLLTPNGNDKCFYTMASEFSETLQLPIVDGPVAALPPLCHPVRGHSRRIKGGRQEI